MRRPSGPAESPHSYSGYPTVTCANDAVLFPKMPVTFTAITYRPRLQGACDLALEGERPVVLEKTVSGLDSVTVLIQGNSVDTKLLVGPMTIIRGFPAGIEWLHTSWRDVTRSAPTWEP